MDEAKKMTPVEEFKRWWLRNEDEIVGWAFIGTVAILSAKLSYRFGYIRGANDLANAIGSLATQNNS